MKRRNQRLRFQAPNTIKLDDGDRLTGIQLAKIGEYEHAQYGDFEITASLLSEIITNFQNDVYGQRIFVDVAHKPENGAAAEIKNLYIDGDWLLADIDITPYGRDAIVNKSYIYLSIDYSENWKNNATKQNMGAVLFGAGLTIRPFIKGQNGIGITLAEPDGTNQMNYAEELKKELTKLKASKQLSDSLIANFNTALKALSDDDEKNKLLTQYKSLADLAVKQLADQDNGDAPITLSINMPNAGDGKQLSDADINKMVDKRLADAKAADDAKQLAEEEALTAKHKLFTDAIDATKFDADIKKRLSENKKYISVHMPDDGIKELAQTYIDTENQVAVQRQLSNMGFNVQGSAQINVGADQNNMKLQEIVVSNLQKTNQFANRRLSLQSDESKLDPFTQKILAAFDADPSNAYKLRQEHKMLSGDGTMGLDNPWFPVGFQRTVIRELFHDFNILQLVQTLVEVTEGQTVNIPYEVIDHSQFAGDGIVYEGGGIPYANAGFTNDTAYVLAMKLALKVSNEVMHFTSTSGVNWEAWAENISSNLRIMRVRITRRLANEIQRASDSFEALDITNEDIGAQIDGATSLIKTVQFPIVRPHQQRNMKGVAVGLEDNPITVKLDNVVISKWNGTGKQSAGTYYTLKNLNLGYIQFVSELGVAVTPPDTAATISYSYATNIVKFDLKYDATKTSYEKHLNGLLSKIGDQKSMMSTDRYVMPEYLLMAPSLSNEISKATDFIADQKRNGTDTNLQGDLEKVKAIPTFGTNAPNLDLGTERIQMGVSNTTTYKIVKPYNVGKVTEAVNSDGEFTGQRTAYGEEYSCIHTPKPVRNRACALIVYNSDNR